MSLLAAYHAGREMYDPSKKPEKVIPYLKGTDEFAIFLEGWEDRQEELKPRPKHIEPLPPPPPPLSENVVELKKIQAQLVFLPITILAGCWIIVTQLKGCSL